MQRIALRLCFWTGLAGRQTWLYLAWKRSKAQVKLGKTTYWRRRSSIFQRETLQVGLSGSDIAEARRLGKKKAAIGDAEEAGRTPPRTPHPVFVKFTSTKVRNEFTSARTRLKGKSIFINDDLTPAEQARRRTLVPIFKSLKKNKKNSRCQLSRDRLLIDGKEQSPSEIAALCAQFNSPSSQPASSTQASLVASAPQSTPPALSSSA